MIQLIKPGGFGRYTNLALGIVAASFVFAFLTWSAAGKSLNLAGMLNTTLLKAVPLTLGALSGILCERSGVVNIAIEGRMLMAAMTASLFASVTDSLWIGLLAGVISSGLLGLLHGVLSIKYKTNQIISGTAINIFAMGMTSYISSKFLQVYQLELNSPGTFQPIALPILSKIPFFGPILFDQNIFVYGLYILLIVIQFMQAREKKDFSASSRSVYQQLLEESFVRQDLKTFAEAPRFLDNPRLFDHYPRLVGGILRDLFFIGEGPKQKYFAAVKGKVGWGEAWSILKDLREGMKI